MADRQESLESIQLARKMVAAMAKGDMQTVQSCFSEDYTHHEYGAMRLHQPRSQFDDFVSQAHQTMGKDRTIEIASVRGNESFVALETVTKFKFEGETMPGYDFSKPEHGMHASVLGKKATCYDCSLLTFDPEKGKFTSCSQYPKFAIE